MKYLFSVLVAGLLLGAGCAHLESTNSTFQRGDDILQLKVERHMDDIIDGPDTEEDQTLTLQLRNYKIGELLTVPSAKAAVNFEVDRFGPTSEGDEFHGTVVVLSDNGKKIKAHLDLVVTAHTRNRSYTQNAKFNGDFSFYRDSGQERPLDDEGQGKHP